MISLSQRGLRYSGFKSFSLGLTINVNLLQPFAGIHTMISSRHCCCWPLFCSEFGLWMVVGSAPTGFMRFGGFWDSGAWSSTGLWVEGVNKGLVLKPLALRNHKKAAQLTTRSQKTLNPKPLAAEQNPQPYTQQRGGASCTAKAMNA